MFTAIEKIINTVVHHFSWLRTSWFCKSAESRLVEIYITRTLRNCLNSQTGLRAMQHGVQGVEGKMEAAPITMFLQRKKTLKYTKTLLGRIRVVNHLRIFTFCSGYPKITPANSEI